MTKIRTKKDTNWKSFGAWISQTNTFYPWQYEKFTMVRALKTISTALFEHLVGRSLLFWTPLSSVTWIKQGDFISALFWAYDKIIFNVLPEKMMTRQSQYFTVFIAHLDNSLSFLQPLLLSWTITRLPLVLLKKSLQRKSKKTGRSSMHATKLTVWDSAINISSSRKSSLKSLTNSNKICTICGSRCTGDQEKQGLSSFFFWLVPGHYN